MLAIHTRRSRSAKSALMAGSAMAFIMFHGTSAIAACPTSSTGNSNYSVSTAQTTNCALTTNDTLQVTESGSIVNGTANAVTVSGTGNSITNLGTIESSLSSGNTLSIANGASLTTLNNSGILRIGSNGGVLSNRGTIGTFNNSGQMLIGTSSRAINNESTGTLTLINTGLIQGIYNAGTFNLNNNGGTISSLGNALYLEKAPSSIIQNVGGLITTTGTVSNDAVYIHQNMLGNLTINGGIISNTNLSNSAVAFNIDAIQTGTIHLNGVNIISDGAIAGSGQGIAINFNGRTAFLDLDSNTVVRGQIVELNGGSMVLTTAGSILGNITAGNGNETVTVNGGSIVGNISLGTGDDTLAINGGSITGNIDLGAGSNSFLINSAFATHGTITTTGGGAFTNMNISSAGNFKVMNAANLGLGNASIDAGGVLDIAGANLTSAGTFTNNGTIQIANSRTLSVLRIVPGSTGHLVFGASTGTNGALTAGQLISTGNVANFDTQIASVVFDGGNINTATNALIATGTGTATAPTASITDNSYLYNFAITTGTGGTANNLYLSASRALSLKDAADNSNNLRSSVALNTITTTDTNILAIQRNINGASTREAYNQSLEATLPTVDNAPLNASIAISDQLFDVISHQMSERSAASGLSSGDPISGLQGWVQALGQHVNQDERGGIAGYDANSFGVAFGLDTRNLNEDNLFGLSVAYGHTDANSDNANSTDTDIDTYQASIYGRHLFSDNYFIRGMASFGWNQNDRTRHDVGGIAGLNANSDYDAWQAGTRWETGRHFKGLITGMTLTPTLTADYLYYKAEGYTESGAGGANLIVGSQDQNAINLGLGLQAEWLLNTDVGMTLRPNIHTSYKYDILNDNKMDTTSSFVAGGGTFGTDGLEQSNSTYNIGTGLKFYNTTAWDVSATYDYTFKQDYDAHTGTIRANYRF